MESLAKNGNGSGGEGKAISQIIGIMFMSRTYAHIAHLKTSSFSKHKALNGFYDSVIDMADSLAEAAQGYFGKLDIPFVNMDGNVDDPINALSSHLKMIEGHGIKCKEEYLKNIFQEIQALYRSTLYLLKELD